MKSCYLSSYSSALAQWGRLTEMTTALIFEKVVKISEILWWKLGIKKTIIFKFIRIFSFASLTEVEWTAGCLHGFFPQFKKRRKQVWNSWTQHIRDILNASLVKWNGSCVNSFYCFWTSSSYCNITCPGAMFFIISHSLKRDLCTHLIHTYYE